MIGIGIDTGGTYTDAVIVDTSTTKVLAKAKALTTKHDLSKGIGNALDALPSTTLQQAQRISLSTTLATNACVEGKGGRAKLIIIGTTDEVLHRVKADKVYGIPFDDVLAIDFEGSYDGKEAPLPDWDEICAQHAAFFSEAESFGITGLYALNNGATVEKTGAEYLEARYGKLVVKATDVATSINVMERGATALLNARLVPVIQEFLDAIRHALEARGLGHLPVSIVRSDGSLMSEELARLRPVETILSGPAASVRGAQALAPEPECLVVDIGGTTSDISVFHAGEPVRTEHIAIGGWQTQVGGVSINTISLGGDTAARFDQSGKLHLSQRRVMPLCIAANRWDNITSSLEQYLRDVYPNYFSKYEMFYLAKQPTEEKHLSASELNLIEMLEKEPIALWDQRVNTGGIDTRRLETEGIVMRCGMTPTDAMHILGDFTSFNTYASELGARALLKSYRGIEASRDDTCVHQLAHEIYDLAQKRLYDQLGTVLLQDRYWPDTPSGFDEQMQAVFDTNWQAYTSGETASFSLVPQVGSTLIGIGAPTHILLPQAARALKAASLVPQHAEVANAIGAICSKIMVDASARVVPNRGDFGFVLDYQVYSVNESTSYENEEEAFAAARKAAQVAAQEEARRRGASELSCLNITERKVEGTGASGDLINLEWVFTAHVEG